MSGVVPSLLWVLASPAPAPADAPPAVRSGSIITLEQTVHRSIHANPRVGVSTAQLEAAASDRYLRWASYGPALKLTGGVQRWNEPFAISLDVGIPDVAVPPVSVRDQTTAQLGVVLAQPLTGLWTIHEANRLVAGQEKAAQQDVQAVQQAVAMEAIEAHLRALEAADIVDLAQKNVDVVEGLHERTTQLWKQGAALRTDVLQVEVHLEQAKADLIAAKGAERVAKASLALQVGAEPSTSLAPVSIGSLDVNAEHAPPDFDNRPELKALRTQREQSETALRLAKSKFLPQLVAVGGWDHLEGSHFQPKDALYVGLQLEWRLWSGGAVLREQKVAQARNRQIAAATRATQQTVELEYVAAQTQHSTAKAQLTPAKKAEEHATEHLSHVEARFGEQIATATEVQEAAGLLHAARVRRLRAEYAVMRAEVEMCRTRGCDPVELARNGQ